MDLITGQSTQLMEEDIDCGAYTMFTIDISDDGQRVIYTKEDAQHCPDIWIAGVDFHNPRRLTHINQSLDAVVMGTSQIIEWRSLDGEKLRGALLLPSDYEMGNAYPLVVWVYSGHFSNNVNRFGIRGSGTHYMQILATRGIRCSLTRHAAAGWVSHAGRSEDGHSGVWTKQSRWGLPIRIGLGSWDTAMGHTASSH